MGLLHLNLIQMSFSGAVFILVIIIVRAVAINRLPKKMFLILWSIALLRLLVPFSIPSAVSVYSVIGRMPIPIQQSRQQASQQEQSGQMQQSDLSRQSQSNLQPTEQLNPSQTEQMQSQQLQQGELPQSLPTFSSEELQSQPQQEAGHVLNISVWFIVRCAGTALCALFFATSYLKWYFRFRTSIPVDNDYVEQWLEDHALRRPISIKQSDRTAAPLTYGVLRPVILLPNKTDWENTEQLQYILLHEYVHIRRFDTVTKFITTIALCIHWFNPFVWVMYVLFNRDLELSCDESVVRFLGITSKADYARVLIKMEAKKSGLMPFYNNFSKNAIEERIMSIMKIKKTSLLAIIAAVIVVVGLTAVFVTSARSANIGSFEATVNPQLLQYMDMTYGQFKEQTETEAEFYHADYFTASIPDLEADVVFEGAYDEELGGSVLADDDKVFRIEGNLSTIVSGITDEMKGAEVVIALARTTGVVTAVANEGGEIDYHMPGNSIKTNVDLDGDGVADAYLQITLDESGNVGPDSYTWLVSLDSHTGSSTDAFQNGMDDVAEIPNYYHSVSDADETGIYLGGAGGIYRIDSESKVQTIYSAPHIAGAALYKDYIFAMEYNVSDNGMTAELIRINKNGSDKKMLTQISGGSYDLRIMDNMLVVTEQIIGDYGLETIFYSYTLDDEGNLISDTPQDVYAWFGLPNRYEDGMRFFINPWFSTKYFGYSCFMKAVGETDINSVWIKKGDEESAEEVVTCSGNPLVAKDVIFYCDSNGETLTQRSLDNAQETVLYEIPDDDSLSLLTYDAEWVYFLQKPRIDEHNELSSFIMRVNLQDHRTEEIYELQAGSYISNFNVYDNNCYFILSGAGDVQWKHYDLIAGNEIENLEDDQTASEVAAPTREEVLAMREHVLEGISAEEIERLTERILLLCI